MTDDSSSLRDRLIEVAIKAHAAETSRWNWEWQDGRPFAVRYAEEGCVEDTGEERYVKPGSTVVERIDLKAAASGFDDLRDRAVGAVVVEAILAQLRSPDAAMIATAVSWGSASGGELYPFDEKMAEDIFRDMIETAMVTGGNK